mmetsp:Transcript_12156/g.33186  ORF Transcript_12156/g.33186 Transcript_12156/m.33186 type:complete len:331 (-) Transcript_12156:182-1174(-)
MEGEGPRYPGSLIVAHAKQLWKQKLEERAQRRGARPSNASLQKLKEFAIRHEGTALFAVFAFGLIKLSLDVFMDHRCEELDSRCEIIDYLGSKCQLSMAKLQRLKEVQAIWMKEIPLACSRGELWRVKLQGLQAQLGDPAASVAFPPSMLRRGTVAAASSTVQLPHALAPDPLQRAPSPETHQVPIVVNIEPAPPRAPAAPIAADLPPAAACIPLPNATKKLSKAQQTPPEAQQDDGSVLQGSSSSSCSSKWFFRPCCLIHTRSFLRLLLCCRSARHQHSSTRERRYAGVLTLCKTLFRSRLLWCWSMGHKLSCTAVCAGASRQSKLLRK